MNEGIRAKFHGPPKPRLQRETHFRTSDPLFIATKRTLLLQIASGKYVPCAQPIVSLPWFGVAKPNNDARPIIDCRYINRYMKAPKFSLRPLPRLNMADVPRKYRYGLKYDISNGFDHLPKHPDSAPYFCIQVDGKFYSPTRILMGETCAPWAFQLLLHDLFKSFLRQAQLTYVPLKKQHIDDCLFLFTSKNQATHFHHAWVEFCRAHGIELNLKKSQTTPTSIIEHIGFELDLQARKARLTASRKKQVLRLIRECARYKGLLWPKEVAKIVGLLGWARGGSPYVLGLLDKGIRAAAGHKPVSCHRLLPWSELALFFKKNDPFTWSTPRHTQTITTDATPTTAGIIHDKGEMAGPVAHYVRGRIFLAELWTACSALRTHAKRDGVVRLFIDNQPAMYAIRKGRSRCPLATKILVATHRHLWSLRAKVVAHYVRSCRNPADKLSRIPAASRRLLRFTRHVVSGVRERSRTFRRVPPKPGRSEEVFPVDFGSPGRLSDPKMPQTSAAHLLARRP